MDVIELVEALKTADGETAMELVERLQCGKVDCSALSANGGEAVAYRYRVKGESWEVFDDNPCFDGCGPNEEVEPLYTHPAPPSVAVPEGWKAKVIELCSAVENDDDLPPVKYALKCGRLINEVKDMLTAAAPHPDRIEEQ